MLSDLIEQAKERIERLERRGFHQHPAGTWQWQTYRSARSELTCLEAQTKGDNHALHGSPNHQNRGG